MASDKFLHHIVFFLSEITHRQQRTALLLLVWLRVSYRKLRGANCVLIDCIHYIHCCIHYIQCCIHYVQCCIHYIQIFILVKKLS